jgi:hypothetical protein
MISEINYYEEYFYHMRQYAIRMHSEACSMSSQGKEGRIYIEMKKETII